MTEFRKCYKYIAVAAEMATLRAGDLFRLQPASPEDRECDPSRLELATSDAYVTIAGDDAVDCEFIATLDVASNYVPLTYEQGRYDERMATGPDRELLEAQEKLRISENLVRTLMASLTFPGG